MRAPNQNRQAVKQQLLDLAGIPLFLRVNRGRNRIEILEGQVVDVYPAVFTFLETGGTLSTFSFADIFSHNLKFRLQSAKGKADELFSTKN